MKTILILNLMFLLLLNRSLISQEITSINNNKDNITHVTETANCPPDTPSLNGSFIKNTLNNISNSLSNLKENLSNIFTQTSSWWIRFLAALILGLLLSLTPCIYPMIPITIGILGVNQAKSPIRSFLIATSYAIGISFTFAIFGFFAAVGSCVFGEMQASPYFIVPLAALLIYFALSMFDFYEIYIPNFLKPKDTAIKGGSFLSAFIFGIISGTVASPCLSPGLLLILNYVSSLSVTGGVTNYLCGFLLLFTFGIGSSLPLLIIGTFSASAKIMPKAGAWMIEVKKLIGILLIGMAAYHLANLEQYIPWYILATIIAISLVLLSINYYRDIKIYDSVSLKVYKTVMIIILFISSLYAFFQAYNAYQEKLYPKAIKDIWLTDFDKAIEISKKENKPIFIDLVTTICSACKSIDNKILQNNKVIALLESKFIPVKIYFDINRENYDKVNKDFGPIKGFPTFIIINQDYKLLKTMGAEFGDLNIEQVIKLLKEV